MPFCSKCGTFAADGNKFCRNCGNPIAQPAMPQAPVAPAAQGAPAPAPVQAPAYTPAPIQPQAPVYAPAPAMPYIPVTKDFSAVTVRYRCPNGHTFDGAENVNVCPSCGAPMTDGGYIQLYRKGNYMGCAVGMGIYIDGVSYGLIANKQSLRIKVPYGSHMIHVTHTTTRKCNDPIITVTPEAPHIFLKASFVKAGFAISVEQATQDDMPTK